MNTILVERQPLPQASHPAGRVVYKIRRGIGWFVVIADFHIDGSWDFAECEGDEPRWHPFPPSTEELEAARRALAATTN